MTMTQRTFRLRLAALLDEFLAAGGDPWWMSRELPLAGMQALDDLRCDLGEGDDSCGCEIILVSGCIGKKGEA
jgi:hypothetical protein